MRVLLAFDKFKDSLTANAACAAAADALRTVQPGWEFDSCPLADGGEGFAEILTASVGGELSTVSVSGPRGGSVRAQFGLVTCANVPRPARALLGAAAPGDRHAKIAIIEMASASGLALLSAGQRDVWQTTTRGTGELMRAAVDARAAAIVLGVGGSATSDLGLGALAALGLEFQDAAGARLDRLEPAAWEKIARIAGAMKLPPIYIACDVTNPLLGPQGAAAVYGPQKGLLPAGVARLDHASARIAMMLCAHFGTPDTVMEKAGAGAAGGIAFGLMVAANAQLLPGFELVARWLDLESRIAAADVVITGEGRFDNSSLSGKGPGAVAGAALALGKHVHVFAGQVAATKPVPGLAAHAITPAETPLDRALTAARENLERCVRDVFSAVP
jgi:glycerate kinase